MPTRTIMLVDLDYFFAQCEELRNPSLKNKPVVIGVYSGRTPDSGAVSTANYLAREYGVHSGLPLYLAKRKLENTEAVFLPVDHSYYEQVSDEVMSYLRDNSDAFEPAGIDEAYLDITKRSDGNFQTAKGLAEKIKEGLRQQKGLTCSIGLSPNKLVAKIAADEHKPDGLTVVQPDSVAQFLESLPVERLLGVGTKTAERMKTLGIRIIADLARYDVQKLVSVFGKSLGTYFHNASLGIDNAAVQETREVESISRIATLKRDTRNLEELVEKTNELCVEIYARLMENSFAYKTVGVTVVATDMSTHSRSATFEDASTSLAQMKTAAAELLERFLNETEVEARRIGVKVAGFMHQDVGQKSLTSFLVEK